MQHQDSLFPEDREKHKRSLIFGTPEFRQAYARYITSTQWKKLGSAVRARAKGHCERCGIATARLEIHHLTYERFQHELLTDLQGVCQPCHPIADREREKKNQQKFEAAREEGRYSAARDTYFTKKYGEDWHLHHDAEPERMDDEFDTWLERKKEDDNDDY